MIAAPTVRVVSMMRIEAMLGMMCVAITVRVGAPI
ncbi:Uncharacterised protein [Mycobacteroides abscessus subsp. abscessus]|nr:Uncharacterised protein [Mycobacteroides abscessus subsp. abscessus]